MTIATEASRVVQSGRADPRGPGPSSRSRRARRRLVGVAAVRRLGAGGHAPLAGAARPARGAERLHVAGPARDPRRLQAGARRARAWLAHAPRPRGRRRPGGGQDPAARAARSARAHRARGGVADPIALPGRGTVAADHRRSARSSQELGLPAPDARRGSGPGRAGRRAARPARAPGGHGGEPVATWQPAWPRRGGDPALSHRPADRARGGRAARPARRRRPRAVDRTAARWPGPRRTPGERLTRAAKSELDWMAGDLRTLRLVAARLEARLAGGALT